MHDSRRKSEALFYLLGIRCRGLWDTQAAHGLSQLLRGLGGEGEVGFPLGLNDLLARHGLPPNPYNTAIHLRLRKERDLLTRRPLDAQLLDFAGEGRGVQGGDVGSRACSLHGAYIQRAQGGLRPEPLLLLLPARPSLPRPDAEVVQLAALCASQQRDLGASGAAAVLKLGLAYSEWHFADPDRTWAVQGAYRSAGQLPAGCDLQLTIEPPQYLPRMSFPPFLGEASKAGPPGPSQAAAATAAAAVPAADGEDGEDGEDPDVAVVLSLFPPHVQAALRALFAPGGAPAGEGGAGAAAPAQQQRRSKGRRQRDLVEVVVDSGRPVVARFADGGEEDLPATLCIEVRPMSGAESVSFEASGGSSRPPASTRYQRSSACLKHTSPAGGDGLPGGGQGHGARRPPRGQPLLQRGQPHRRPRNPQPHQRPAGAGRPRAGADVPHRAACARGGRPHWRHPGLAVRPQPGGGCGRRDHSGRPRRRRRRQRTGG